MTPSRGVVTPLVQRKTPKIFSSAPSHLKKCPIMNITCLNKEYNWSNAALARKKVMYRCLYTLSIFKTID